MDDRCGKVRTSFRYPFLALHPAGPPCPLSISRRLPREPPCTSYFSPPALQICTIRSCWIEGWSSEPYGVREGKHIKRLACRHTWIIETLQGLLCGVLGEGLAHFQEPSLLTMTTPPHSALQSALHSAESAPLYSSIYHHELTPPQPATVHSSRPPCLTCISFPIRCLCLSYPLPLFILSVAFVYLGVRCLL